MVLFEGLKWFVILWYAESCISRMVFRKQSIEQAPEFAPVDKTDVTNLDGEDLDSRRRKPQGVAETRMRDGELITISVTEQQH
jgi:hypothetical protein